MCLKVNECLTRLKQRVFRFFFYKSKERFVNFFYNDPLNWLDKCLRYRPLDPELIELRYVASEKKPWFREITPGNYVFLNIYHAVPFFIFLIGVLLIGLFFYSWGFSHLTNSCTVAFKESTAYVSVPNADHVSALLHYLTANPNLCGAVLPYGRVYKRLLMLRRDENSILTMINPKVHREKLYGPSAYVRTVNETSLFCTTDFSIIRLRVDQVTVEYDTISADQTSFYKEKEILTIKNGKEANCMQHLMDIIDGYWFCDNTINNKGKPRALFSVNC